MFSPPCAQTFSKPMSEDIRVGIVGCGNVSRFHASAIRAAEGVALAGACGNTLSRAEAFCRENEIPLFESFDALLASEEIDAVALCTPNGLHGSQILKAIEAGKHVLVEKPMALTLEELDAVVEAAAKSRVTVSSVCQHRFTDEAQAIKQAIDSGELGKIVLASLSMRFFRSQEYYDSAPWRGSFKEGGGGVLMNQGIHGIDLMCYLLGKPVQVCGYAGARLRSIQVEDTAAGAVLFESGAMATVDATVCASPAFSQKLFISGEKGTILLDEDEIKLWTLPSPCPVPPRGEDGFSSAFSPTEINPAFHARQYEDFARAIKSGTPPLIDAYQGRLPVELILGLYQSSKEGRPINIR